MTDPATLRRLAEAATPGPWETYMGDSISSNDVNDIAICDYATISHSSTDLPDADRQANAAYIAAANPQAVMALLDRLAKAETLVEQCRATLEAMHPETGMPDSDVARLYNAMMEKLSDG